MATKEKKSSKKNKDKKTSKTYKTKKEREAARIAEENRRRLFDEIAAIILLAFGIFFAISMHTDLAGAVGEIISTAFKGLFGLGGFILPYSMILYGIAILFKMNRPFGKKTIFMLLLIFLALDFINAGRFIEAFDIGQKIGDVYTQGTLLNNGGLVGMYCTYYIVKAIGMSGLYISCTVTILVALLLTINTPLSKAYDNAKIRREERKFKKQLKQKEREEARALIAEQKKEAQMNFLDGTESSLYRSEETFADRRKKKSIMNLLKSDKKFGLTDDEAKEKNTVENNIDIKDNVEIKSEPIPFLEKFNIVEETPVSDVKKLGYGLTDDGFASIDKKVIEKNQAEKEEEENFFKGASGSENHAYTLPPIDLLKKAKRSSKNSQNNTNLAESAKLLEDTLKSFNVDARVINVTKGSSVTRYEIQPAVGVKVASIVRLADDLALNLKARSIRIEAPIPGKAAVGIEVENESREMVCISEIISSQEFKKHPSKLAFAVGKDIGGAPVVADLAKMPHMLIAGATGSGKSVCINTIIASILYRATPDEVKMVLIDPKMVELGNYNGIPHLLIPVVTDSAKAAAALNWAVAEMTDRYKKFAANGVREIKSYNELMRHEGNDEEVLPQIVIIIDELADLMMVASSQVEDAICRLAQLARAAGMHLIVATQRPSVDVVTGLIKANVPSRIAFMVSSQIDSRTIIDMAGAEKLVGNGDMLYKPQDLDKPLRVQGPFISDEEVRNIIEYVKKQADEVEYDEAVISHVEKGQLGEGSGEEDVLMDEAVEAVILAGQASASMLQRKFRIGYNRAARMVEDMEARGIIGPQDGSRPRTILISQEEWLEMKQKVDE